MAHQNLFTRIMSRNEVQKKLQSEKLFSDTLIESMPGVLYFYDDTGRFLRWSRNFEKVTGYSGEEISRMHPLDFFAPKDKALLESRIAEVFEKGESSVEAEFVPKSGKPRPYFFTGRSVNYEGKTCLVGVGIDITERRRIEDRLMESERKYRELVENANSIILRWNSDGRITLLNEYGQRFFGYTSDEIIGRHVSGTIVPETESSGRDLRRLMDDICANPEAFEKNTNENMRRNGEHVWIAWTNRIVREADGQIREILSIGTDITEQKRAEESRRESEARYRKLFEYAPDGIVITDQQGNYLDVNASMCRMTGYSREEIIKMNASQIVVPEEVPRLQPALDAIKTASRYHFQREWRIRRKNGSTFEIEVIAAVMPDGNYMGMIRDITDRKQATLEREKRHRAETADRIKSEFLATMSHELRTPLNSIIGFTGIIMQGLAGPLTPEQNKQLGMVRASSRHLLALVNDVLDISKIEAGQLEVAREPFDVRRSITKVLELVTPQAQTKKLDLHSEISPSLGDAVGDVRRFEQMLLNLLSNAIKFTDRGQVTLAAGMVKDSEPKANQFRVTDTGIGIKAEDLPLLFHPFQQVDSGLARSHEGTGLGLAICQRLVGLMGGSIKVESEWGKGSTFIVTLPLNIPEKS